MTDAIDKMRRTSRPAATPPDLITALKHVTPSTLPTALFVGDQSTLDKIKSMMETLDVVNPMASASTFYLYKLQYVQGSFIETHLKTVA